MVQRKGTLDLESEDLSVTLALTSGYTPECQPLTGWSPHLRHVSAACPTQPDSPWAVAKTQKRRCSGTCRVQNKHTYI